MRALALLLLLPSVALAQGLATGGGCNSASATCKGATLTISGNSSLAATTLSGNLTVSTNVFSASTPNIFGNTADSGAAIAVRIGSGPTYSNATAKLVSFATTMFNGTNTEKAFVDKDGTYFGGAASNPAPLVLASITTAAVAIEYGTGTSTAGGALAITFPTAYSTAPVFCGCSDVNAAPAACGISTAASTTAVTFTIGSARADTVKWFCIGAK